MTFSKPTDTSLSPLTFAMLAIMIGGALFGLNKISVWFVPIIFAGSCLAMAGVWILNDRERKKAKLQITTINHDHLAQTNIIQHLPWLKENIRGQDHVIEEVGASIQQRLALARPGRTLGNFLLVGPTGTGKTFMTQLIAQAIFPSSEPIILRMNQYKHADDVFTLIGPPPGSPGYEVGGTLSRPVLENPCRVIVFDELEKCHKDLQHCLYDILDTATCREKSSGKIVDFSACVFFATCNAGVDELRSIRDQTHDPAAWLGRSRDVLVDKAGFDRAFLARWNGIYLMDELSPVHVAEVACLQLAKHWQDYGIELTYTTPDVLLDAVERNEDFRQYGVRQLGAYLQEKLGPAITQARRHGIKRVSVGADANGDLTVRND